MDRVVSIVGGTGPEGSGLALRLGISDVEVVIGSRKEEKAKVCAKKLNNTVREPIFKGYENPIAAEKGDIVIIAVPFEHQEKTLQSIKNNLSEEKIVVDVCNPVEIIEKNLFTLKPVPAGSAAEQVQKILGPIPVVCAFKTISALLLQNLNHPLDCTNFICSDYEEAKKEIMELSQKIPRLKSLDAGPLMSARLIEAMVPLILTINHKYKTTMASIKVSLNENF
ncbi:MAG: NADPH-dependent F420 reductase [Candidatus Wukongarchaeota archaeon]|nr:NADPH-dependent F420 reductase [Candidatus Wukongarchaeota archaeon]